VYRAQYNQLARGGAGGEALARKTVTRNADPAARDAAMRLAAPDATPEDVAAFTAAHLAELRVLADGAGLSFLSYLMELAEAEASAQAAQLAAARVSGSVARSRT
jgi:hypothetical protein